jgi:hypothetical protein
MSTKRPEVHTVKRLNQLLSNLKRAEHYLNHAQKCLAELLIEHETLEPYQKLRKRLNVVRSMTI